MIAGEKKEFAKAITYLKEAVEEEDGMLYNEPRDWQLPARQFLGAVLLQAKQFREAERVYREDLQVNPNNRWSLWGLQKALEAQNKKREAMSVSSKLKKLTAPGDDIITASVF